MSSSHNDQPETISYPTSISGFAARVPSQGWEPVPLADSPQHVIWVWYKPANFPQGIAVNIPDETFRSYPRARPINDSETASEYRIGTRFACAVVSPGGDLRCTTGEVSRFGPDPFRSDSGD